MARGLTHIRCGTASTLESVYNTRSQKLGNSILKRKERGSTCRRAKDKANVEMRISRSTKSCNLSANLEGM